MGPEVRKMLEKVLEKFGISQDRIIGKWNVLGHLVAITDPLEDRIEKLEATLREIGEITSSLRIAEMAKKALG